MRADGRRTKGLTAIEQDIPHIMPKRVDAQNYVTEYVDEEIIKDYIRSVKQQKGVRMSRMAVIIAAYFLAALQHPYINRFVVGSRVYDRNHFCVSFVMLKKRADGSSDQTTVKVFMEPTDDIFTINQRINDVIEKNSEPKHENNTDKFAAFMFSLPVLPYLVMALVRFLDRFALISWMRNPYNGNRAEVTVNRVGRREIAAMLAAALAVTAAFFFILRAFHTANLLPSTISVTTSFLAVYLTFRRSPYHALAYAANDVILIILWAMATREDSSYVSVLVCFIMFFFNDLYGFANWSRMQRRQQRAPA